MVRMRKHVHGCDICESVVRVGEDIVQVPCERCWVTAHVDDFLGSEFEDLG